MVIEKVKEIKEAEKRAEEILREAEKKASGIKGLLSLRLKELIEQKERDLAEETKRYRTLSEKETERKINILSQQYKDKKQGLIQEYQRKIVTVSGHIWKEIEKDVFMLE